VFISISYSCLSPSNRRHHVPGKLRATADDDLLRDDAATADGDPGCGSPELRVRPPLGRRDRTERRRGLPECFWVLLFPAEHPLRLLPRRYPGEGDDEGRVCREEEAEEEEVLRLLLEDHESQYREVTEYVDAGPKFLVSRKDAGPKSGTIFAMLLSILLTAPPHSWLCDVDDTRRI